MSDFLLLLLEFFKTGLFAVGGGLATIPFLTEISRKYGWYSIADLTTMIAVSESTPGPVGVNMSTYVGNQLYGFFGGIAATLALVCPSVIVVCIIARALQSFRNSPVVNGIFEGLRPAVVGFIITAAIGIYKIALLDLDAFAGIQNIAGVIRWKAAALFAVLLYIYRKKNPHPIVIICIAAAAGILLSF